MADQPEALPLPDKPPLHLRGGYLVVATPEDPVEACLAAPAVRALRHARPHATIALTAPEDLVPLWERAGRFEHLVPYPRKGKAKDVVRGLEATGERFESSVCWEPSAPARAFARLGIQQRFGYRLRKLVPQLTDPLDFTQPFGPPRHRVHYYLTLAETLGVPTMQAANFRTPKLPARPDPARVLLVPGSEFGPAYRWPADRFAEVALGLRDSGCEVVIAAGAEAAGARVLTDRLGGQPAVLDTGAALGTVLDQLAGFTAVLANDGLVPHLAAHLGVPAAVIFGPGHSGVRRPLGRMHRILEAHVACAACGQARCPLDHRCMEELGVGRVTAAVRELLGDGA